MAHGSPTPGVANHETGCSLSDRLTRRVAYVEVLLRWWPWLAVQLIEEATAQLEREERRRNPQPLYTRSRTQVGQRTLNLGRQFNTPARNAEIDSLLAVSASLEKAHRRALDSTPPIAER